MARARATGVDDATLTITPIVAPETLDAPDAGDFLAMVRLGNLVCLDDTGHDYLTQEPEEMFGFWRDGDDWTHLGFYAHRGGELIGALTGLLSNEEGSTVAEFDLFVHPDRWGEGAEESLLAAIEAEALARGRVTVQSWTLHRPHQDGARLPSSTGWGSIPAGDRQTVFMTRNGYALGQVERNSAFDLHGSLELAERALAEAIERAGSDYRLVSWTSPTPRSASTASRT